MEKDPRTGADSISRVPIGGRPPPRVDIEARARVDELLRRLIAEDPLFSPLAELVHDEESTLGEGGMGVVRLVHDRRLGRKAALKLIKGQADEGRVKRFVREAQITARLDHPGVPPVYDFGRTVSGQHFILMRFVDGESLAEVIERGRGMKVDVRPLIEIVIRAGEAVAYAHGKNVVHRDLKPANLMVGAFGEVLVMDWGLARDRNESASDDQAVRALAAADAPRDLTQTGAVLGTVGYMPPEQARGEDVDARADIFALGAILTEVLTGRPPLNLDRPYMYAVTATISGEFLMPRQIKPDVPPELDAIAAKSLAPRAGDRYPTAKALIDDLRAWLEGRPVSVYRYGALDQARLLARRHPTAVASGVVALALSLLAAAGLARKNGEIVRTNAELEKALARAEAATKARDDLDDARRLLQRAEEQSRMSDAREERRALVRQALEKNKSESTRIDAGRLLAEHGDLDEAKKILRACADELPPGYKALLILHEVAAAEGSTERFTPPLRELMARARARGEDNELVALAETEEAMQRRDLAAARRAADRVVRLAPGLAAAHLDRAQVEELQGDVERARRDFDEAIALDARDWRARNARAHFRIKIGDAQGAFADWQEAIFIAPWNGRAWAERASGRLNVGDFDGAIADANEALKRDPGLASALVTRGNARNNRNDRDGAIADFDAALAIDAKLGAAWSGKGNTLLLRGKPLDAIPMHRKAVELEPTNSISRANLANVLQIAGQLDEAIGEWTKVIELDALFVHAWFNRGLALAAKGKKSEARRDLVKARQLARDPKMIGEIDRKLGELGDD